MRQQDALHAGLLKHPGIRGDIAMDAENSAMKRLEFYRQKRMRRKRILMALALLTFLLIAGTVIVDRSVNGLVSGEQVFSLVDVKNHGTSLEITFMNNKIAIDTSYLEHELERLKNLCRSLLK